MDSFQHISNLTRSSNFYGSFFFFSRLKLFFSLKCPIRRDLWSILNLFDDVLVFFSSHLVFECPMSIWERQIFGMGLIDSYWNFSVASKCYLVHLIAMMNVRKFNFGCHWLFHNLSQCISIGWHLKNIGKIGYFSEWKTVCLIRKILIAKFQFFFHFIFGWFIGISLIFWVVGRFQFWIRVVIMLLVRK